MLQPRPAAPMLLLRPPKSLWTAHAPRPARRAARFTRHPHAAASFATSPQRRDGRKPYYVTTPIFYVNAAPHVGHMYSMVLADVIKRWQVLQGRPAVLSTGTDEHGMKVERAALAAGSDVHAFCDQGAEVFKALAAKAGIANDHFVRTTDPSHVEGVQFAWSVLQDRGYIYLSKHEGWYSVSDETFYPQSGVHLTVDPATGRKVMTSIETGKEVEWSSEVNYRFRLSAFRDRLLDLYKSQPDFIVPSQRHKEIQASVEAGLDDLSVSRPSSRLAWGVPIPTDKSQTMYVWLDALMNYATKAGYPWTPGTENKGGWPADCQVIGKDIARFHCIYWPAFLMALGLPLPKQILIHAHWTLGREKMAKSTGNVVDPFYAIDRFGLDAIRFYLAHDGAGANDADYGNEYITKRYKTYLQHGLGGLTSRILRSKNWDTRRAVQRGATDEVKQHLIDMDDAFVEYLRECPSVVADCMAKLDVRGAVKAAMNITSMANGYVQQVEPWTLAKSTSEADRHRLDGTIYASLEAIRLSALLLQPVMPERMSLLLDMLGVDASRRTLDFARVGADDSYGVPRVALGAGLKGALFPPLLIEDPPLPEQVGSESRL